MQQACPYQLSDFDYPLPESLIARFPLERRDASRMLLLNRQTHAMEHRRFADLPALLSPGDVLVVNNTRVLPARLIGHRRGFTGEVEIFLLNPHDGDPLQWAALMRPAKKLKPGTIIEFDKTNATVEVLSETDRGRGIVKIHPGKLETVDGVMNAIGQMPIPPYLNRDAEESDKTTYQTVYSRIPGAQAAPTAGLHFTPEVMQALHDKGVEIAEVTLAVSSGTFRTVEDEEITNHRMDPEYYTLDEETVRIINEAKSRGGKIIAVGTTVAKTLETVASKNNGELEPQSAWSELFIYPGFEFKIVDALLTNFHLPKSTLLMLVSAFYDRDHMLNAYHEAIREQYRFYSYGDCMLIS